jgi:acyl-CoA synthetase (AMP-forming)/AMP-acid ligase II
MPNTAEVLAAYRPEFVMPRPGGGDGLGELGYTPDPSGWVFRRRDGRPAGDIFRQTAVLLATSGSTGSPKAVRLTYSGVAANSDAVIRALSITAKERAATTLPITHSYGLSAMWDEMTRAGATSITAVPTTYAAFGPAHVNLLSRTKIRTMTQSGARLGDELALRLSRMMEQREGRFVVTYGQTEATARWAASLGYWVNHATSP